MGVQELLEYFDSFEDVKALSAFGLEEGHMGMSVLIFDASVVGYLEAERLGKHFDHQGLGRNGWNHHPTHMDSDGKPRLYGYLATEQDLEVLKLDSPGKQNLKFELVSYQETVVNQYKQMSKDLIWYKETIAKQERSSKALEEENKILRQRTQMYHDQNEKEMDFLEKISLDQLKVFQDLIGEKKKIRVNLQQGECKTVDAVPQRNENVEKDVKPQHLSSPIPSGLS